MMLWPRRQIIGLIDSPRNMSSIFSKNGGTYTMAEAQRSGSDSIFILRVKIATRTLPP
jgi:hypothetical protein